MRRRLGALGVAGLSLVALALVRGSGGGPPLYDGICTPPSYALLGTTPGPGSASKTYTGSDIGQVHELVTPESPTPQAQIITVSDTLTAAGGANSVTVTIAPVKPPAIQPDGSIDGNVYDFEATSGGKVVPAAPGHPVTIVLEATSAGGPSLTLEHFDGSHWTALKTFESGCGSTFEAAAPTFGLFALVAEGTPQAPGGSPGGGGAPGGGSGPPVVIILGAVLVLLSLLIAGVRTGRRRR